MFFFFFEIPSLSYRKHSIKDLDHHYHHHSRFRNYCYVVIFKFKGFFLRLSRKFSPFNRHLFSILLWSHFFSISSLTRLLDKRLTVITSVSLCHSTSLTQSIAIHNLFVLFFLPLFFTKVFD